MDKIKWAIKKITDEEDRNYVLTVLKELIEEIENNV
jgi:hypothetical protein